MTISKRKMRRQFESNPLVLRLLFSGCISDLDVRLNLEHILVRVRGIHFDCDVCENPRRQSISLAKCISSSAAINLH